MPKLTPEELRVLELLCAIQGHEAVWVKVETLRNLRAALAEQAEWWAGSPLRVDGSGAMWQATVGDGAQRRVVGMGDTAVGAARAGLACLVSIAAQERTMRERALAEQAEEHARELAQARAEVWEEAADLIKPRHQQCMHRKCEGAWECERQLRARAAELRGGK